MARYDEIDTEDQPSTMEELSALAYRAGYGAALLAAEAHNSNDARGDRIVEAAGRISGAGMWGDPFASTEPEEFE